jgi:hypothetical protein
MRQILGQNTNLRNHGGRRHGLAVREQLRWFATCHPLRRRRRTGGAPGGDN